MAFEDHYSAINGVRLHYVQAGQGPLMIFLHGFPEFWHAWTAQLLDFGQDHLAVAPDMRGYNLSEKPAAVEQYREALRVDPRLPGVHFELGEALLQVSAAEPGQQEAQKEFEAALALNPEDVKSECRLGDLLSLHGDQRAALDHYTHAVMVDPNEPEAQAGLGKVLIALSQPEQALAHLLDAERLDPLNAGIHYRLSQTYRVLGRMPEAEKEVARFQERRKAEDRLHLAYSQVYKDSSSSETLNPDIPH